MAMKNHAIKSVEVPNEGSCRVMCYMEPNCVSINVGPVAGGSQKCDLNNATDTLLVKVVTNLKVFRLKFSNIIRKS